MPKKKPNWIQNYYEKKRVVTNYNKRRFRGDGGDYINRTELESIVNLVKQIVKEKRGKTVRALDLGAGRGRVSLELEKLGCDVYCLDASQEMTQYLTKFFPRNKIIRQSVFKPFKTKVKFDVITSLRFMDHFLLQDQNIILQNAISVLKDDGRIIYPTLNKYSLENILSIFFNYKKFNYYYAHSSYQELFSNNKLTVLHKYEKFFLPRGIFLYIQHIFLLFKAISKLDRLLTKYFPKMSSLFVYSLKKIN